MFKVEERLSGEGEAAGMAQELTAWRPLAESTGRDPTPEAKTAGETTIPLSRSKGNGCA
jgi:hypothetical protein